MPTVRRFPLAIEGDKAVRDLECRQVLDDDASGDRRIAARACRGLAVLGSTIALD